MPRKNRKSASSTKMQERGSDDEESAKNRQSCEENFYRDSFYKKLIMLNQSSGLSLVFNFWETKLDLYLVYKEVTERGGAYEVSRAGKWNEVASAVSIKTRIPIMACQIRNLYEILLYLYEQIHHYRTPGEVFGDNCSSEDDQAEQGNFERGNTVLHEVPLCFNLRCPEEFEEENGNFSAPNFDSPRGKRKSGDSLSEDDQAAKHKCKKSNLAPREVHADKGKSSAPNIQAPRGPGRPKTIIREPGAPLTARTGYQMFLKIECERLKKVHGESSAQMNVREMAIEAWRQLPKDDRLPYLEESRKDKERFDREMAIYKQNKEVSIAGDVPTASTTAFINFSTSQALHNDYNVPMESSGGNLPVPAEKPSNEAATK